ncbi:hypothetical protein [Methylobacterium nodulans]|uniref:Uncharacterized protein n=1 Tax=Methylobacterium nodulans (strain LMG 21967 / CNCM I-2342 / ORS 2060) TaxID=460265 RepID=B8IE46_METNO|nr:hypothetical protein [Methylobacterium nodulans]ACL57592.1 hypothetical protein Mnod_2629 [Methylobacterium nodulans ORS 2060]
MTPVRIPCVTSSGFVIGNLAVITPRGGTVGLHIAEGDDRATGDLNPAGAAHLVLPLAIHLGLTVDELDADLAQQIEEAARNLAAACKASRERRAAINERLSAAIARGRGDEPTCAIGRYLPLRREA